jgi:Ni/Fe-hydrogenase subunit HybB-like protein
MRTDSRQRAGYADGPVTKVPNWHALVAFDMLFNNLTTGLFLVAAICELVAPNTFTAVANLAYPIALALLTADLGFLVLDLGTPTRFHHMLRVFKPSSPMSLGTWCLTIYSLPLTVLAAVSLLPVGGPAIEWVRRLALIAGLLPALGSAVYKGVLFSTSSQPVWKDARWLGCYLTNSSLMLGCAELLALSILMEQERAVAILRPTLGLLLLLNAITLTLLAFEVKRSLMGTPYGRLGAGGGMLVPLVLLAVGGSAPLLGAVLLIVLGALVIRLEIVRMPHVLGRAGDKKNVPAAHA